MGILDTIEGMADQQGPAANPGTNANVASGMMQALEQHPGGLGGIIDSLRNNGMADHIQNWSNGQQSSATPGQIEQGLGNTGFIENVAARTGVSPEVAKMAMATVLPMILAHFTNGGQQAPPQSGYSGMASQILSKLL
ncbi:YidB family protein [Granulicella arctica]|uniref:YidB family protein n=1 Tax=Granulicella arctica TaxID=940613 RepID=UPI0021DF80F5|nr:YidB family protein [Granulicella arctica]